MEHSIAKRITLWYTVCHAGTKNRNLRNKVDLVEIARKAERLQFSGTWTTEQSNKVKNTC